MKIILLSALVAYAAAKCPNGCSGHGQCGAKDMCDCHKGWVTGDCSQRQCLSGEAWLTSPQGDINFDGDVLDATVHDPDHRYDATSVEYIDDQFNPNTGWESWPATFHKSGSGVDEAHFYMECSNRGNCDRKTGQCECFPGYTGEACRRTVCPEDCSGHGQCQTVQQQAIAAGKTYNLWDKDMSRSCVCDPTWTGPTCGQRACPIGDDPLTINDASVEEIQWVDVYTDDADDTGRDGPFAGFIKFKYTDYFGEEWITGPVNVVPVDDAVSLTAYTDMAAAAEAALEALPNNVLRDVQVTVGMCDKVVPGVTGITDGGEDTSTSLVASKFYNAKTHTTKNVLQYDSTEDGFTLANSLSTYSTYPTTATTAYAGGSFSGTVYENSHPHCVRFQVYFVGTPGDLTDLSVDTSGVTVVNKDSGDAETTDQGAESVGSSVSDERLLGSIASAFITDGRQLTCPATAGDGTDECSTDGTNNEITIGSAVTHWVHTYDRIQLLCGTKDIGIYTVSAATAPTATVITTIEKLPACAGDSSSTKLSINVVSKTLWVDGDLTGMDIQGAYVKIGVFTIGPVEAVYWQPGVSELSRTVADDADIGPFAGRLIVPSLPNQPGGTTPYTSYTGDTSLTQIGAGQSEKSECSDRGVCDTETGICQCFGGYTGVACEKQNAISA